MIHILWEYKIKSEKAAEFERYYSASGIWVELFRRSSAYRGTALLRDTQNPSRFVTMDRWDHLASYEAFRGGNAAEYAEIDRVCAAFTSEERLLGIFETV